MTDHTDHAFEIAETAAAWVLKMSEDDSQDNRTALDAWLRKSPENLREFLLAEVAWHALGGLRRVRAEPIRMASGINEPRLGARQRLRRRVKKIALAAAIAGVLAAGAILNFWLEPTAERAYSTKVGEIQKVELPEGSIAHLNTRTSIRWSAKAGERRVELIEGEVLLEVKRDEQHPFRVVLDGSEIMVLGTRFSVYRKSADLVVVRVLEGTVEVRSNGPKPWVSTLHADQQIEFQPSGRGTEPQIGAPNHTVDWSTNILRFRDAPMAEILAQVGRYTEKPIKIQDARIADIRVAATFEIADLDSSIRRLEELDLFAVTITDDFIAIGFRDPRPGDRKGKQ
jgi:transmembrane sensor